jgi:hypothetical protein
MRPFRPVLIFLAAALLLAALGPSPASAYYAPCQNVTGPSSAVNIFTHTRTVDFSVVNQADGQTYPGSVTVGADADYTVDSLTQSQGIVAWRVKRNADSNYMIYYATYDPVPNRGWMVTNSGWIAHPTTLFTVQHGVVWWESHWTHYFGFNLQ